MRISRLRKIEESPEKNVNRLRFFFAFQEIRILLIINKMQAYFKIGTYAPVAGFYEKRTTDGAGLHDGRQRIGNE